MTHARGRSSFLSHASGHIAVERAVAEFRAGRPVVVGATSSIAAMPIDALDMPGFQLFRDQWSPARVRLLVTAQRANALGIGAEGPVVLSQGEHEDPGAFVSLAIDPVIRQRCDGAPAGPAANAALDLAKLAELLPALLIAETAEHVSDPGLIKVEAAAVGSFRRHLARSLRAAGSARVPIGGSGMAQLVVFRDALGGSHTALILGEQDYSRPVPVRLHSACLTGDAFGCRRCDCGDQLRLAITCLAKTGGIILYLQQEGRGLGLANKIRAYGLQDLGFDTIDANVTLGFQDDERDYQIAARMLHLLGARFVLLLTNNPAKLVSLSRAGIEVCGSMPLRAPINPENRRYLTTKALRAGHSLDISCEET